MTKRIKKSNPALPVLLTLLGLISLGLLVAVLLRGKDIIILNPKGMIAHEQLRLMITVVLLMLEIAIPALILFYFVAWKYRETNEKAIHDPNPTHGRSLTLAIWTVPIITMLLLAVVLVPATHKLQPQKPISNAAEPLTIQVVATRWKWLFIYPDQNIATVNYVQIPVNTPVQFEITADETPMSSFWIPHLGGQLYAMTEHVNRLNLIADTMGDFEGSVAEINGAGFAGMRFRTHVGTQADFDKWVNETIGSNTVFDAAAYRELLIPSENNPAAFFSSPAPDLFSSILGKYAGSHQHNTERVEQ